MNTGLAWACSLAIIGTIFGVALSIASRPVELPPGCRLVGKVQQCDKESPTPTPTTSDPFDDDGSRREGSP